MIFVLAKKKLGKPVRVKFHAKDEKINLAAGKKVKKPVRVNFHTKRKD